MRSTGTLKGVCIDFEEFYRSYYYMTRCMDLLGINLVALPYQIVRELIGFIAAGNAGVSAWMDDIMRHANHHTGTSESRFYLVQTDVQEELTPVHCLRCWRR